MVDRTKELRGGGYVLGKRINTLATTNIKRVNNLLQTLRTSREYPLPVSYDIPINDLEDPEAVISDRIVTAIDRIRENGETNETVVTSVLNSMHKFQTAYVALSRLIHFTEKSLEKFDETHAEFDKQVAAQASPDDVDILVTKLEASCHTVESFLRQFYGPEFQLLNSEILFGELYEGQDDTIRISEFTHTRWLKTHLQEYASDSALTKLVDLADTWTEMEQVIFSDSKPM